VEQPIQKSSNEYLRCPPTSDLVIDWQLNKVSRELAGISSFAATSLHSPDYVQLNRRLATFWERAFLFSFQGAKAIIYDTATTRASPTTPTTPIAGSLAGLGT
jgi:hypothetical protein